MNNNNNNHHKTISSTHHKGSNGSQACAACKYQRRKCAPDCILAPYFPHDRRQRQFFNAHKLFGISNITKIIRKLDQPQKDEAMRTIIFQSEVRAHDPVGGCYRVIKELQRQIEFCQAELNIVLHQLALFHAQSDGQNQINHKLDYSSNEQDNQETRALPHDDQGYNIFRQIEEQHGDDDEHEVALHEIDSWGLQNSGSGSLDNKQPSSSVHNECEDIKQLLLTDLDILTDDNIVSDLNSMKQFNQIEATKRSFFMTKHLQINTRKCLSNKIIKTMILRELPLCLASQTAPAIESAEGDLGIYHERNR